MRLDAEFYVFGKMKITKKWSITYVENVNVLYYILDGKAAYIHNNHEYIMEAGHLYILPYAANCTRKLIESTSFDHVFFDFTSSPLIKMDTVLDIDVSKHEDLYFTLQGLAKFFERYADDKGNVYCLSAANADKSFVDAVTSYFYTLMNLIEHIYPINTTFERRIVDTVSYIHKHYSEPITVQSLADLVYLEKNYFIRLFKKHTGVTPHTYLRNYRLNRSISLLKSGLNAGEVANLVGYQSLAAFSSALKKTFGMLPSEVYEDESI